MSNVEVQIHVKIGKNLAIFQSTLLIPQNKNKIFQKFFNLPSHIGLRESGIENRGLFSHQTHKFTPNTEGPYLGDIRLDFLFIF